MGRRHQSKWDRDYARVMRRRRFEWRRIMGRAVRWAHKLGSRDPRSELMVYVTPRSLVGEAYFRGVRLSFRSHHVDPNEIPW